MSFRDGAEELHDGMKDFKKDGIDEICNLYKDNVPELVHKLQALQKAWARTMRASPAFPPRCWDGKAGEVPVPV